MGHSDTGLYTRCDFLDLVFFQTIIDIEQETMI